VEHGAQHITVKAMLIAPDAERATHAVSLCPPTPENPLGYHRLIGGTVEVGESHRDAVIREVREELDASIRHLRYLDVVESIFRVDGHAGHEIVFVYTGRLDPQPPREGAELSESDGTVLPVVWRPLHDAAEPLPLYPEGATALTERLG
jgi:ADP-ribose pyrophosphatase YjhB (NUDIX family)